ncbi:MAG: CocE/NonD family hydrolase [Clostridia bacterium]|nr:CocE/NonD family hydrolase [Clostridia bacterium]
MSNFFSKYEYLESAGNEIFTIIFRPTEEGKFPTVIFRSPYVWEYEKKTEEEVLEIYKKEYTPWVERGYAVICQHCRGTGKSKGDFLPFICDREDGLNVQEWVRHQSFYNGEIYLVGGSYTACVHFETAPFADDIKGVITTVHDSDRYNFSFRNGNFKKNLLGCWYVDFYKAKSGMKKNKSPDMFEMVPLKDFTETVFGEKNEGLGEFFRNPDPKSDFWETQLGGKYPKHALENIDIPVLITTAFYDIFAGGVFDMWYNMDERAKKKSALIVTPYNHGDGYDENTVKFENGARIEKFGEHYLIDWIDYVRGKKEPYVPLGKVTYYRAFENGWTTDDFDFATGRMDITIGDKDVTYKYDPDNAPSFLGGLSCGFGGSVFQEEPYKRDDIVTVYTEPFSEDVFVKGKMSAKLKVKSDCEDTAFYIRLSLTKDGRDLGIRDDITSLCFQLGDYEPNSEVTLDFTFDEHAFAIKKGEKLRIDISSADKEHYIPHTNTKGALHERNSKKIANNTVYLSESVLTLPIEE